MGVVQAVVLDLFGTVVDAPTLAERRGAATRLAGAARADTDDVERYLISSWGARHDGSLENADAVADDLIQAVGAELSTTGRVVDELTALGQERLCRVDDSVVATLGRLRRAGLAIGVLSDAAPEIAAAWPHGPLDPLVDVAVFSCGLGAIKPDPVLYQHVLATLEVDAAHVVYCGDGGGNELNGALAAGMRPIAVQRRGEDDALAYGATPWAGPAIGSVEKLPAYLGLGVHTTPS